MEIKHMDTVSIVFLACTTALLLCIYALHVAFEAQLRTERYVVQKMFSDIHKIEAAMTDAKIYQKKVEENI